MLKWTIILGMPLAKHDFSVKAISTCHTYIQKFLSGKCLISLTAL